MAARLLGPDSDAGLAGRESYSVLDLRSAGMFAPRRILDPIADFLFPRFATPEMLLKSVPIVLVWVAFGLLFLRRGVTAPSLAS